MPISLLKIENFRNLTAIDLAPETNGINIISGKNGSGKTSILEAIHYLGYARSFRTSQSTRLIQHSTEKFSLFSQLVTESDCQMPIGIERELNGSTQLRIAEREVNNIAELAQLFPIRTINSQSHTLLEAGPAYRRKYLDWGLFYQDESFLICWRHYERALKQRNALLKEKRFKNEIDAWTVELIKYGLKLDTLRREYIKILSPVLSELVSQLLSVTELEIEYRPGWDEMDEFEVALARSFPDECRFGTTQLGPHRADFDVSLEGISAKHYLSRGQQKLLICAMILAQGAVLAASTNRSLIYLVDDLPSELDFESRQKLMSSLIKQKTQVFITAIDSEAICECIDDQFNVPVKVFHVEHGNKVVEN